jgi:hypothetical protein
MNIGPDPNSIYPVKDYNGSSTGRRTDFMIQMTNF